MIEVRAAPTKGPTQYIQWCFHELFQTAGPSERVGFMLEPVKRPCREGNRKNFQCPLTRITHTHRCQVETGDGQTESQWRRVL